MSGSPWYACARCGGTTAWTIEPEDRSTFTHACVDCVGPLLASAVAAASPLGLQRFTVSRTVVLAARPPG